MVVLYERLAKICVTSFAAAAIAACSGDSSTAPGHTLKLEALSTTGPEGIVGETVDIVPLVRVTDETGQPVGRIKVTFTLIQPQPALKNDAVINSTSTTDVKGFATAGAWTLGSVAGPRELRASILDADLSAPIESGHVVIFRANARAAAASELSIRAGDKQVALPGDEVYPPIVHVADRYGNDADGTVITFSVTSGGGSIGPVDYITRMGAASPGSWKLGPAAGLNSVTASAPGVNSVTINAQALDSGPITWYDLPAPIAYVVRGSIALCEKGLFELVTVETFDDVVPGQWKASQLGTYTLSGNGIALKYNAGFSEEATLAGDVLSLVHTKRNSAGTPPEEWKFVKRR